ncbi:MAG TPA: hypothetical protein ACFYD3_10730 [Candidatus Hypogeohydataceae bacterium YC41]
MPHVGELVEVYAPASGEVEWFAVDGQEVELDEVLGIVIDKEGRRWDIIADPDLKGVRGILLILPKVVWEVGVGATLAYIRITRITRA